MSKTNGSKPPADGVAGTPPRATVPPEVAATAPLLQPEFTGTYRDAEQYRKFSDLCQRRGVSKAHATRSAIDLWIANPKAVTDQTVALREDLQKLIASHTALTERIENALGQFLALSGDGGAQG